MYCEKLSQQDKPIVEIKASDIKGRYTAHPKFINSWLLDASKKTFSKLDFYPDPKQCPANEYNTFTEIQVKPQKNKELVKPILKHFSEIFEKKEYGDFIIKSMAYPLRGLHCDSPWGVIF